MGNGVRRGREVTDDVEVVPPGDGRDAFQASVVLSCKRALPHAIRAVCEKMWGSKFTGVKCCNWADVLIRRRWKR